MKIIKKNLKTIIKKNLMKNEQILLSLFSYIIKKKKLFCNNILATKLNIKNKLQKKIEKKHCQ